MRALLWPSVRHRREPNDFFKGKCAHVETVFLAEASGGTLVGFIEINVRNYAEGSCNSRIPYVEGWYVDTNFRNEHIGRRLMEAAEQWARSKGFKELRSDAEITKANAITGHQALGFREVERHVSFLKKLS